MDLVTQIKLIKKEKKLSNVKLAAMCDMNVTLLSKLNRHG